ncbi:MAG: hypothetical protein K2P98_06690 [Neisseriaceae bacterium]|nr:hypothetical protein [Neisseriaceae bacterium]
MGFNVFRAGVKGEKFSTQGDAMLPFEILANAESVTLWYEKQSADLGLAGLFQKISAMLAELKDLKPTLNADYLKALMRLDDLNHAYYEEKHLQFSRSTLLPQFRVQALHRELSGYGQSFLESYLPFLSLQNTDLDSKDIEALLPDVVARMMRYLSELALFQFYRYMVFTSKNWWLAHQLYSYAEQRDWLTLPTQCFEGSAVTSIAHEYKTLLLMGLIHCDHLTPMQLHSTLFLVRGEVAKHLILNAATEQGSHAGFFVHLKQNAGPYFWAADSSVGPLSEAELVGLHEINTQGVILLIRAWLVSLKEQQVPHALAALHDTVINPRLLANLKSVWNPQDHLEVRKPRSNTHDVGHIKVIHSLLDLHRLLREEQHHIFDFSSILPQTVPQRSLDDTPANQKAMVKHEKGVIEGVLKDISESGWGLNWVERVDERLNLGDLLGLEIQEKKWAVGILRRVQRQTIGSMQLGVGKLSDKPVAVTLGLLDGDVANLVEVEWLLKKEIMAILLPQTQESMNVAQLILPSGAYQISREYRLRINGKVCQVALGAIIESGVDWQVCYLRILSAPKLV